MFCIPEKEKSLESWVESDRNEARTWVLEQLRRGYLYKRSKAERYRNVGACSVTIDDLRRYQAFLGLPPHGNKKAAYNEVLNTLEVRDAGLPDSCLHTASKFPMTMCYPMCTYVHVCMPTRGRCLYARRIKRESLRIRGQLGEGEVWRMKLQNK